MHVDGHVDAPLVRDVAEIVERVADEVGDRERLRDELDLPGLDAGEVEEVRHHAAEPVGVVADAAEVVARLLGERPGHAVQEVVDVALDGGQRGPELVGDVAEKVRFELIHLTEPGVGRLERPVRGLELGRPLVHLGLELRGRLLERR